MDGSNVNWLEAINAIHSVEFDVTLNVVSSTDSFFEAVRRDPAVLEAYSRMLESGELREEAMGRLYDLARMETDPRFENPNDTPLAVLLWLTNFAANEFVDNAASWVDQVPRCWHAKELAQRIMNPPPSLTGNPEFWAHASQTKNVAANAIDKGFTWVNMSNDSPRIRHVYPNAESSTPDKTWATTTRGAIAQREGTT